MSLPNAHPFQHIDAFIDTLVPLPPLDVKNLIVLVKLLAWLHNEVAPQMLIPINSSSLVRIRQVTMEAEREIAERQDRIEEVFASVRGRLNRMMR
jgi:hypothetical protein